MENELTDVPRDEWVISAQNPKGWEQEGKRVEKRMLANLPRGKAAFVELSAAISRSVAACVVCDRAVPKGSVVLSVRINLPEPRRNPDGSTRNSERFIIHAGCMISGFEGQHDLRVGADCFDCGAPPAYVQGHPWRAFVSSRHAPAPLCPECAARMRWRPCEACILYFPSHMVSRVIAVREAEVSDDGYDSISLELGLNACEYCAARAGAKTLFQKRREDEEFAQLRKKIAEGKVFGS